MPCLEFQREVPPQPYFFAAIPICPRMPPLALPLMPPPPAAQARKGLPQTMARAGQSTVPYQVPNPILLRLLRCLSVRSVSSHSTQDQTSLASAVHVATPFATHVSVACHTAHSAAKKLTRTVLSSRTCSSSSLSAAYPTSDEEPLVTLCFGAVQAICHRSALTCYCVSLFFFCVCVSSVLDLLHGDGERCDVR